MSYKLDLTDLERGGETSLTQQLVDRFVEAIETGGLEPGDKLPPTRALASDAGINHLTAARVYRRLAEEGWVTASVGRGTFVRTLVPAAADERGDVWQAYVLPDRPVTYQDEIMDDSFRMADQPGMISLATGFPSPRFSPVEDLARIAGEVFEEEGARAVSYTQPEGDIELREQLAARASGGGVEPDQVIVTGGAQQALDIVFRALLEPGDVAVIEQPTFTGSLLAMRSTGARVIGVPVDGDGLDVDVLEQVLARHEIKLCALQATCQNPTGVDLSPDRRARLAALAVDRNFFLMDDRVYSDLRYEGDPPPPLRLAAPGHVIEINSLSKAVGGGLRLGWLTARGPVLRRLSALKQATDFHTPSLIQHMAARYLAGDGYERQVAQSLPYYRDRRDALLAALERHMAGEYEAESPGGGHHIWVTLTRPVEERLLYAEAVRHGVSFTPGGAVMAERSQRTSLRLSFSLLERDELDEGVKRLARALREVRRRERTAMSAPLS